MLEREFYRLNSIAQILKLNKHFIICIDQTRLHLYNFLNGHKIRTIDNVSVFSNYLKLNDQMIMGYDRNIFSIWDMQKGVLIANIKNNTSLESSLIKAEDNKLLGIASENNNIITIKIKGIKL